MKTTKFLASAASILMAVCMVSCEKDDDKVLSNHVYLTTSGPTTLVQGSEVDVEVIMTLSQPVTEATTFEMTATGTAAEAIQFDPQAVTISAGTNMGIVKISVDPEVEFTEPATATITVKNLNESKFDIKETVTITIVPPSQISEAEAAFAAAFKAANGIDIAPLFGDLQLTGTIEFPGGGNLTAFTEPTTIQLSGVTTFHLNPASTMDEVILDMTANPMGMSDFLLDTFRKLTVEDKEFFASDDEDNFGGPELMSLIAWNENSPETFTVTLPGLKLNIEQYAENGTIEFVTEGENFYLTPEGEPFLDSEGDPIYLSWADSRIGFEYSYTAWDRNLAKIIAGDPTAVELLGYGITAHPGAWLGTSSVLEDEWLLEEDGEVSLYCEPSGSIDFAKGTMTFEFPFDHSQQYGYSRVKVTYKF